MVLGEYMSVPRDGQLYFPSTIFRPSGTENIIYGLEGARSLPTRPFEAYVGKTEDHHLTGIALSDTNKRYIVEKVSPNALQTCTHFLSSYSVTRVIRQKVSNLTLTESAPSDAENIYSHVLIK